MSEKKEKKYKVIFNGTKGEEITKQNSKFSKFVNNVIKPYAGVSKTRQILILINFSRF